VEVDGVTIEARPDGQLLFLRNLDVPGVVGRIGTILGEAGVNIAGIHLGRPRGDNRAVSILNVDGPIDAKTLGAMRAVEQILFARPVRIEVGS
jgi:hypothetical protein